MNKDTDADVDINDMDSTQIEAIRHFAAILSGSQPANGAAFRF